MLIHDLKLLKAKIQIKIVKAATEKQRSYASAPQ